jgi:hypothetical protein
MNDLVQHLVSRYLDSGSHDQTYPEHLLLNDSQKHRLLPFARQNLELVADAHMTCCPLRSKCLQYSVVVLALMVRTKLLDIARNNQLLVQVRNLAEKGMRSDHLLQQIIKLLAKIQSCRPGAGA